MHINEVEDIEIRATRDGETRLYAADSVRAACELTTWLHDEGWKVWWA